MAEAGRGRGARRWLNLALVVLALGGTALLAYSCLRSRDASTFTAPAARLAAASDGVTYVANGRLYVVAQPDGGFLAFDERLPAAPGAPARCGVRWLPAAGGGAFQKDQRCGGGVFQRDGRAAGSSDVLLRHPVRLAGKNVVVDIRQCTDPRDGRSGSCAALVAAGS